MPTTTCTPADWRSPSFCTFNQLVGSGYRDGDHAVDERSMLLVQGMRAYTEMGVIRKPSVGTPEKGQLLLASLVASFGQHLDLLNIR